MRLAIVGSRGFQPLALVTKFVSTLKPTTTVVSGGARGVDTAAAEAAASRGLEVEIFEADWKQYGRKAGPLRNTAMVATVDGLVAFWDGRSAGTLNAIMAACDRRIWLRVYYQNGSFKQLYDSSGKCLSDL
jgi:YspA, cpYpsA-related SLOG family